MLSVIIINSDIYERYQKYEYFFNWFEDHQSIAVCMWKKDSLKDASIDELVPQLFDIVKNVTEWDAYIVDEPFFSADYIENDFLNNTQFSINPYERANAPDENYNIEDDQLLRLVYFLGGRGVQNLSYMSNYKFRAVRPTNIFLLTPRVFDNLDTQKYFLRCEIEKADYEKQKDPDSILTDTDEPLLQYSDFWFRYDYPANCRFLVFDIPDLISIKHENAWFVLWLSIVSLAINTLNTAELGPYKLYTIDVDISEEEFTAFLNKFFAGLSAANFMVTKEIESEVENIRKSLADVSSKKITEGSPVYVTFPHTSFSAFYPKKKNFGNTKDTPVLDYEYWNRHRKQVKFEANQLFKATYRGKREAIDSMNRTISIDTPILSNQYLSRYDVEDITDMLNVNEIKMLELETDRTASRPYFEKKEKAAAEKIEKAMIPRIMKRTFSGIMLCCILIYLFGFLPFIISSAKHSMTSSIIAVLITIFSAIIIYITGRVTLKLLKHKFVALIDDYSDVITESTENIRAGAQVQSQYLTLLLDYMEKYQMLSFGRVEEVRMQHIEQLTSINATYQDAMEQCKSIAGICHVHLSNVIKENDVDAVVFEPGNKIYLYEDTNGIKIPLNSVCERLNTPFGFVNALFINEEIVYENSKYYGSQKSRDELELLNGLKEGDEI